MATSEKKYTQSDGTDIKLVERPSDLDDYDNEPNTLRAVLSCGHVTSADTLTDCCKAQLDKGEIQLKCTKCNKKWSYEEVRLLAKLTAEEQLYFDKVLGKSVAKTLAEIKNCPGCDTFIEREQMDNLCVQCTLCTKQTGKIYEFCWQCLKPWIGDRPRADRCDNQHCPSKLDLLKNCKLIKLPSVENIECPSIRACPSCGVLNEHSTNKCKHIQCSKCSVGFCFLCLKLATQCLKNSTHFIKCSDGVAPRQTSIPWSVPKEQSQHSGLTSLRNSNCLIM